ncbi:MAG TPA: hypothetical protein VFR86_00010 [Burkholderiaceae bacterium]|nr:hypothetical protein [Burkholderiaceae bacterium]
MPARQVPFESFDRNNDGYLSVSEAQGSARQAFGTLDRDRDGRLSPQEWEAQR